MRYPRSPNDTSRIGTRIMAFDSAEYPVQQTAARLIDAAPEPCPIWTAGNPDRALALLFVAPQDCDAVDVLTSH